MTRKTNHIKDFQLRGCSVTLQFTNTLMRGGDRANASKILLDSIKNCKSTIFEKNKKESNFFIARGTSRKPLYGLKITNCKQQSTHICASTVCNVEPIVETRKVRVRGSTYQVPLIPHIRRRKRVAMHWMVAAAESKKRSSRRIFLTCLGQELFDSLNKGGSGVLKRDQMHKLAAHSRAYARYRWW